MTYGKIVAKRWKKQYYDGRKKEWKTYPSWANQQPESVYIVLLEIRSKAAITALINASWARRLPKRTSQGGDK